MYYPNLSSNHSISYSIKSYCNEPAHQILDQALDLSDMQDFSRRLPMSRQPPPQ